MKYFHFHFRFELNAIKRKVFFVFFLYEFEYIKCNYIFYSQTSLRVLFFHLTWPLSVVSIGFSFLFVVCVFFFCVCVYCCWYVWMCLSFCFEPQFGPIAKKNPLPKTTPYKRKCLIFYSFICIYPLISCIVKF